MFPRFMSRNTTFSLKVCSCHEAESNKSGYCNSSLTKKRPDLVAVKLEILGKHDILVLETGFLHITCQVSRYYAFFLPWEDGSDNTFWIGIMQMNASHPDSTYIDNIISADVMQ